MTIPAHTDRPAVAILNRAGERLIIWHVDVGPTSGLSRLSGAWVLGLGEVQTISNLVGGYRIVCCSGEVSLPDGVAAAGVVDVDGSVEAVREQVAAADERFTEHQATVTNPLVRPQWPPIDHPAAPRAVPDPADDAVQPALALAHGLKDLADGWSAYESLRLARPFLIEHGGPVRRALPLIVR
ncbi:hypothetical protein [Nocardia gamkensis]|uniref:hypothetical protein n=1 Tax=Nocardia gamkensis TaxID=352869 RepID=UPI0037CA65F5